jgi:hypothetical protein
VYGRFCKLRHLGRNYFYYLKEILFYILSNHVYSKLEAGFMFSQNPLFILPETNNPFFCNSDTNTEEWQLLFSCAGDVRTVRLQFESSNRSILVLVCL